MRIGRAAPRRGAARVVEEAMFHTRGRVAKARGGVTRAKARAWMPEPRACRARAEARRAEAERPPGGPHPALGAPRMTQTRKYASFATAQAACWPCWAPGVMVSATGS